MDGFVNTEELVSLQIDLGGIMACSIKSCRIKINNCNSSEGWEVARVVNNELWHYGNYESEYLVNHIAKEIGDNAIVIKLVNK